MNKEIVPLGNRGPEPIIEHPVGVGREGEAVVGIVVAGNSVLVDVGGLDDGGGFRVEPVAGKGAGEVVAAEHVALEAAVASLFLSGFELVGVQLHGLDGCGIGNRQPEPGAEHDLFARGEVDRNQCLPGLISEPGVLKADEELRIEVAEACGGLGFGWLPIGGEGLPNLIPSTAEGVERHGNIRLVALAFEDEFPVIAEAGNEAHVVFHPAVRNIAGFDQVDDGEEHQRLMRRDAALRGAGRVEVGEFAEPVGAIVIHKNWDDSGVLDQNLHLIEAAMKRILVDRQP